IFDVADRVVLLATPQIPAIKNAKMFFDVTSALDYPPEKVMLVLYAVDRRAGIRSEDIEASIRHPIAASMPTDERAAFIAVNQGVPLVVGSRNSPTSQAILSFARTLSSDL